MSYVLIIGAKSDIAKACAREFAKQGYSLYLAARKVKELDDFAKDLSVRYEAKSECIELDVLDYSSHAKIYQGLKEKPVGVITAAGLLGDQTNAQVDFTHTQQIIDTNFTGLISLIDIVANDFEQRKNGFIVGISSVAGDRGRQSNYIYGAAKAAFTTYLSGLRNRLYKSDINVLTVKPGFVNTSMTEGMDLPPALTATPEDVAKTIYKAVKNKRNILYVKWMWLWIMLIIKHIPEFIFKKLNL